MLDRRLNSRTIRAGMVIAGVVLVILPLIADQVGLSAPGVGVGKVTMILAGLIVAIVGLFGRRVINLYRTAALMLLNTVALVIILELVSAFILRGLDQVQANPSADTLRGQRVPYYSAQSWSTQYWAEHDRSFIRNYEPFVIWRRDPFDGETINVNENGIRLTPGANCLEGAYEVFTFGGSTMWGSGSPDWETIAAHLQSGLQAQTERPVCVTNYGESAWNSTQGVIQLLLELQKGHIPDLVIFYSGVNDLNNAYGNGHARGHARQAEIAARLEQNQPTTHPLVEWLRQFQTITLIERLLAAGQDETQEFVSSFEPEGVDYDQLAADIVQVYLNNYDIVEGVAARYGFASLFFWQPSLPTSGKPLTSVEQQIQAEVSPPLGNLYRAVYAEIAAISAEHTHMVDIADVFDSEQEGLYWDFVHVTPEGNRIVAARILIIIEESLGAIPNS